MHSKESSTINPEQIETPGRAINLFELSHEDISSLKENIERYCGLVRIFIHPFYESFHSVEREYDPEDFKTDNPKVEIVEDALRKIIATANRPPVIIFEEALQEGIHISEIPEYKNLPGNFYIVFTQPESPEPFLPTSYRDPAIRHKESWKKLTNLLKELGVKKIIIGGMFLETGGTEKDEREELTAYRIQRLDKGAKNINYSLGGCVGDAVGSLAEEFDVEISGLSHPHSRKEIIEIESGLK